MLNHGVFGAVAVAGTALGLLGLVAALLALRALARIRRSLVLLHRNGDQRSFLEAAADTVAHVDALREETGRLRAETASLGEELTHTVRRVALVRYDAFPDVGGRMSFSVAMLADDRNGVVLTAINGRHETRVYAKRIVAGTAEQDLSPEEREAIAEALGTGPVTREPVARRR